MRLPSILSTSVELQLRKMSRREHISYPWLVTNYLPKLTPKATNICHLTQFPRARTLGAA